jgi:hypothetical protein
MTQIDRDQTPTELAWVAERLEQERPTASPLELDRMKLQARTRAARGARSQAKGSVLKSRVAITAILMLGLLTGGTGTTLALVDTTGSAAQRQYPSQTQQQGQDRVLGAQQGGGEDGGQVLGTTQQQPSGATQPSGDSVQGGQQVVATEGGSDLPFTGFAAVPLIVLGVGLMVGGLVVRRRTRPSE